MFELLEVKLISLNLVSVVDLIRLYIFELVDWGVLIKEALYK